MKRVLKLLLWLIGLGLAAWAVLVLAIVVQSHRLDAPRPAGAIIVLGARVEPDGGPSPALKRRLDLAARCYHEGYAPWIITTGARGDDEPMPEGDAMRTYLLSQGIPAEAVTPETASYNTQQNLENAQALLAARGVEDVLIVTSDYHLWRAVSIAGDLGLTACGAGSLNAETFPVAVRNILQESLSWCKYLLLRLTG